MTWDRIWVANGQIEMVKDVVFDTKACDVTTYRSYHSIYLPNVMAGEPCFAHEYKRAFNRETGDQWHFCPVCDAWVSGEPFVEHENCKGPLCGRDGEVFRCRNCGVELDFRGSVS